MAITDYVEEAAEALRLPEELRRIIRTIFYDPGAQEWYANYHDFQEAAIPVEIFSWALRLIGWLKFAYPQGPEFPEASCG
ncbi:MAG: hypothetical protein AB1491_01430 [Thermodesulfobacteriota bacterium]